VPDWNPGKDIPSEGFWFPGSGSMAIVPSQTLLYIAGTDYDHAWQGQFNESKEKLFCYNYGGPGDELTLVWEYQFCTDDDCSSEENELIVRGWDEQTTSFYNVPSPALADGHVYYNSYNGKLYCFGSPFDETPNAIKCPTEVVAGSSNSKLDVLRKLRDIRMAGNALGETLISLYYKHAEEISEILLADEDIQTMTSDVISGVVEKVISLNDNKKASIDQSFVLRILDIADSISANARPQLKMAIIDVKREIKNGNIFNNLGIIVGN
jgi:hypothetical protein